jgi:DNA-binding SARP family transcriptional activator
LARTRIQLCGRLIAAVDGRRIEADLPGRQGRLLFAYLVVNRTRATTRDELIGALWPDGRAGGLAPLLSKLRRIAPLEGRGEVRLTLQPDAFVDLEAAREAIHRAESAVHREAWSEAWGPARVALHTAQRGLLRGEEALWIDDLRYEVGAIVLRAHECVAAAGLGLGGAELAAALRSGRALVEQAPLRESGYRLLMEALAAEGNVAEALTVYEQLRLRLRDELGVAPSPAIQALHRSLLALR